MNAYIRIEAQSLMQDRWPTFFVDMVAPDGNQQICRTSDLEQARRLARERADAEGLRVVDETYAPEVMARFHAKFAAAEAIEKARAA
jgi:hypothetical protein